jgi:predicted phosphodiesterase
MYPDTPTVKIENWLEGVRCDYLVAGHTHVPMIRKLTGLTMFNPGSVGQPRDGDWRASCMIFDTVAQKAEIIRLDYDIDMTCDKIRNSMPHADELIAILKRGY